MEFEKMGKIMRNLIKTIKKNFIDIKFISISLMVLIFVSLFVFKPVTLFKEGLKPLESGEKFISGEAPTTDTTDTTKVVKENDNEEVKEPQETYMIDSCELCSKECPNNEPSCIESKKFSCIECEKKKTLNQENNDKDEKETSPIVINVYAGSPGTHNMGEIKPNESSNALKNPNVTLSNLLGNTGVIEYPPANSTSGMIQDTSNSVEETAVGTDSTSTNTVETANVNMEGDRDVTQEVKANEGTSSFVSGIGGPNKVRYGQIIPNVSYSLLSDTQMEIDEMKNL